MNLFGSKKQDNQKQDGKRDTIPSIDTARQRVESLTRRSTMRGRAAAMLAHGQQEPPTAQRQVTGN